MEAKPEEQRRGTERRRLEPEARRTLIEQAALRVFAERGFEAATMQEIATAAGVVASVIYDYYRSKRALYLALLEREGRVLIEGTVRVSSDLDLPSELHRRIDDFLRAIESDPFLWRLVFRNPSGDAVLEAAHARLQDEASDAIAAALAAEAAAGADGDGPGGYAPTAVVAQMIKSSLGGLAAWWWEHQEVDRAELVTIATAFLWEGLRGPGSRGDG